MNDFKDLLTYKGDWRANFDGLVFSRLDEDEAAGMELPFTMEEVHHSLGDLNGDKAPSLNGLDHLSVLAIRLEYSQGGCNENVLRIPCN